MTDTHRLLLATALMLLVAVCLATAPAHAAKKKSDPLPEGFGVMTVAGVSPMDGGGTVMLLTEDRTRVVPIGVGGTEALTIALRAEGEVYTRPLTHDLFDEVLAQLGAEVVQVRIDALRDRIFVATVTVQQGRKRFEVDARSSDAIALALGAGIPILVADSVLALAGLPAGDMGVEPPAGAPGPGGLKKGG